MVCKLLNKLFSPKEENKMEEKKTDKKPRKSDSEIFWEVKCFYRLEILNEISKRNKEVLEVWEQDKANFKCELWRSGDFLLFVGKRPVVEKHPVTPPDVTADSPFYVDTTDDQFSINLLMCPNITLKLGKLPEKTGFVNIYRNPLLDYEYETKLSQDKTQVPMRPISYNIPEPRRHNEFFTPYKKVDTRCVNSYSQGYMGGGGAYSYGVGGYAGGGRFIGANEFSGGSGTVFVYSSLDSKRLYTEDQTAICSYGDVVVRPQDDVIIFENVGELRTPAGLGQEVYDNILIQLKIRDEHAKKPRKTN